MLIIGHRGGGGTERENTLSALRAGVSAGIDILHIDVHTTRDHVPILLHDASLYRTHKLELIVSSVDYQSLRAATKSKCPPTLSQVLDRYFGRILINIELRSRGSAKAVIALLENYTDNNKWDALLFSSFHVTELAAIRRASKEANIALLQDSNPFAFITYHRFLHFAGVGFHRLHTNKLALEIAKRAGIFTYAYSVDRPKAALLLAKQGFDGVMTNYPERISTAF